MIRICEKDLREKCERFALELHKRRPAAGRRTSSGKQSIQWEDKETSLTSRNWMSCRRDEAAQLVQ